LSDDALITVAIPTLNGSRHLVETLRGVLSQDDVRFDLILSDDRSTDETLDLAMVAAGDRVKIAVNSERLGLAGNWNRCVSLSRTPLVAVIHQDDVLRPGHLAAHVRAFQTASSVGFVASASQVIDGQGRPVPGSVIDPGGLGPVDRTFAAGESLPVLAAGNPLRCSAVSIRAAAHADVGGFDPSYRYVVDWEFWLRLARRWSLTWLANPSVDVRWHTASETHRFRGGVADLEETERVLEGLRVDRDGHPVLTGEFAGLACRRLSRAYLNRAHVALRGGDGRLGRDCLKRAVRTWPGILRLIVADPRLAAQMAAVWVAPGASGRLFARSE